MSTTIASIRKQANLLDVLGIADREDPISNLLRYCFVESVPFRRVFLAAICGLNEPLDGWEARTRIRTKLGTPDLVLYRRGEPSSLIIIENKLDAREGSGQTVKYADPACTAAIIRELGLGEDSLVYLRYLTLFPGRAKAESFESHSYRELLDYPVPLIGDDSLADQLVIALYELLTDFYAQGELDERGPFLLQLSHGREGAVLDGGYLGFLAFLDELVLPPSVEVLGRFRNSWTGRKVYGAVIGKRSWKANSLDDTGATWSLHPDSRNLHLEPQFDALKNIFSLYIHYETNPYYPVQRLKARVPADQYRAYEQRREAFKRRFALHLPDRFKMGGRSNQIAKAILPLADCTVAQSVEMVSAAIATATQWIDRTLIDEAS